MNLKLKTSKTIAIEGATPLSPPYTDLILDGTERACSLVPELKKINAIFTSEKNSFDSVFGTDCKFYYNLSKYSNDTISHTEIGIGYIVKEDGRTIFKRLRPLLYKQPNSGIVNLQSAVDVFHIDSIDEYIILSSYYPSSLSELLTDSNCIIASSDQSPLNAIYIDPNSVLGRLDNNIESLSLDKLSDKTFDLICSYSKQIVLNCSQLDVKKLKTSSLQLKPSNRPQSKEGTLIYNDKTKCLEYYTGDQWRTLQWKDHTD